METRKLGIGMAAAGLLAAAFIAGGALLGGGDSPRASAVAESPTAIVTATATVKPTKTATVTPAPSVTAEAEQGGEGSPDGGGGATLSPVTAHEAPGTDQAPVAEPAQPAEDSAPEPEPDLPPAAPEPEPAAEPEEAEQQPEPVEPQPEPAEPAPAEPEPAEEPEPEEEQGPPVLQVLPHITLTTPEHQATGVAPGTSISIKFSLPMDQASVQDAFEISPNVPGKISWDIKGRIMTFDPIADFDYGTDVTVSIAATATAIVGGESLLEDYSFSFVVVRKSVMNVPAVPTYDGHVFNGSVAVLPGTRVDSTSGTMKVGTWSRGFLTFDLSNLPADLIDIESAELSVYQSGHHDEAYTNATGALYVERVPYGTLDAGDFSKLGMQVCGGVCVTPSFLLSNNPANGWKSVDVAGFVRNDWNERDAQDFLSQFRLRFQKENSGDEPDIWAWFFTGNSGFSRPVLQIVYTHP